MNGAVRLAAGLTLCLALTGCLAGAPGVDHGAHGSDPLSVSEVGADVGNDRPQVSHDGRMVRRREVVALRVAPASDVPWMRRELASAASRSHLGAAPISSSVLEAAVLDRLSPDLVISLSRGATPAQGRRVLHHAVTAALRKGVDVRAHAVASVLVHDLRFTLETPRAAAVSRSIAREGILADALGSYTTRLGPRSLEILYTGPLLSDLLVRSVRRGIARPAHVAAAAVTVRPRSAAGAGVDLADEPVPPPETFSASPGEHHH